MKEFCKLASRILEIRVSYKTRGLKTRFLLAELDTFMPHRSRVFYSQFQKTQKKKVQTQKKKEPEERRTNPRKRKTKKRRKNPEERKKERRRRSTTTKKTHGTHKSSLHQAHPDHRSTVQFTISIIKQTI